MSKSSEVGAVLVTGGAGFLGANLVRALLLDDRYQKCPVVVLDDLTGGSEDNLPDSDQLTFVHGSILDVPLLTDLFDRYEFRIVFHLAAYAAEGLSHFIRRFNYTNNLIGSVNLINEAVRHRSDRFIFTSSIAVYGAAQVPMTEKTMPVPEDPYGVAKLAVEMDLKAAHEMFGLNYTVFRPHNVYGEYQNLGDKYRNVVGIFMNRLLQGKSLPVFGDGSQQRAFSYVADLLPAMIAAPFVDASAQQVFNIGASQPTSVLTLAETVCREFGVEPNVELLDARNEVHIAWSDHSHCERVFGSAKETSLEDGIRRMAKWARSAGARESGGFGEIEITRNLPPSWQPLTIQTDSAE